MKHIFNQFKYNRKILVILILGIVIALTTVEATVPSVIMSYKIIGRRLEEGGKKQKGVIATGIVR